MDDGDRPWLPPRIRVETRQSVQRDLYEHDAARRGPNDDGSSSSGGSAAAVLGWIVGLLAFIALVSVLAPTTSWPTGGGDDRPTAPRFGLLVKTAIPGTRTTGPEPVFFDRTYVVDYRAGRVALTGSADGSEPVNVDDVADIYVRRPDGTWQRVRHDFSSRCRSPLVPLNEINLTSSLQVGRNLVRVTLRDQCGPDVGNTDVHLVADDSTMSSAPSAGGG